MIFPTVLLTGIILVFLEPILIIFCAIHYQPDALESALGQ